MQRLQGVRRAGLTALTAAALTTVERQIAGLDDAPLPASSRCGGRPCAWQSGILDPYDPSQTWDTTAVDTLAGFYPSGVGLPPKFYIKEAAVIGANLSTDDLSNLTYIYRVPARATGGTDAAQSILQATYARKF